MTLAILIALSQLTDGLAYQLAHGHGRELNPGAALFISTFGPTSILGVKIVTALLLGFGSYALLRRDKGKRIVAWLAIVGFVGALTELIAVG